MTQQTESYFAKITGGRGVNISVDAVGVFD